MSNGNSQWVSSHLSSLVGVLPAPGQTWRFCQTDLDRSTHDCLDSRGLIRKAERDTRHGHVWETPRTTEELVERLARGRGYDDEDLLATVAVDETGENAFLSSFA